MRPLAGTESVLDRRWRGRTEAREVVIMGRPIPDDPADAEASEPRCIPERRDPQQLVAEAVVQAPDRRAVEVVEVVVREQHGVDRR